MKTFVINISQIQTVIDAGNSKTLHRNIAFATQVPLSTRGIAERIRYCNSMIKSSNRVAIIDLITRIAEIELPILEALGLATKQKRLAYELLWRFPSVVVHEVQSHLEAIGRDKLPYEIIVFDDVKKVFVAKRK